ncbi:cytochrome b5 domain-containing protein, partial [Candidatus Parcubacteria bacterium]
CWIVVDGGVYEVTGYLASHPGGAGIILSYCGKDASAAFHSKGKRKPKDHSPKAYQQLSRYYIGPLGGKKLIGK